MMNSSTTATFKLCYTHVDDGIGTPCCKMTLLCCSSDEAPDFMDNPYVESVGVVSVHFKKSDVQKAEKRYNHELQKYVFSLSFTVEMKLDTEQGTLSFQSFVNNKKAGRAVIDYTQIEHSPVAMR